MNVKSLSIMLLLTLLLILKSNAQSIRLGLVGGYDNVTVQQIPLIASQWGQPYTSMSSYNLNCFLSLKSKSRWGFSIEPGFMKKGADIYRSRYEFKYLQMPLLADFYVFNKLYFSIGPEFGHMINAKCFNYNGTIDTSTEYEKFELSGIIGINYILHNKYRIGIRYNHGLTYIRKLPEFGANWEILRYLHEYNQYFQLIIGFNIFSNYLIPSSL